MHHFSSFFTNFLPTLSPFIPYNGAVLVIGLAVSIWFFQKYKETNSRQLLNSLPGVWTSLGLLGTFIAICASLGGISTAEAVDNVGKTVANATPEIDIKTIIGDLIPAFSTSIYGLLFATSITIWNKVRYAKEDKLIDDEINNVSPEKYISDIAVELKAQTKKNEEYNEKLNNTLGNQSKILESFVKDFVARMDGIFKEMGNDIRANINSFGQEQFKNSADLLNAIVAKLAQSTESLVSKQSESVTSLMSNTNTQLEGISSQIDKSISAIGQSATSSMSTLISDQKESLTTLLSGQKDSMATLISDQKESLNTLLSGQKDSMATLITGQNDSMAALLAGQKDSMTTIIATQKEQLDALVEKNNDFNNQILQQSTDLNKQVSDNLRESLTSLTTKMQSTISEQCAALSMAIANCVDELKESYSFITEHMASIRSDYQQSTEAYRDAVQNAHDINDSFEHTIRSIDDSIKNLDETNKNVAAATDLVKQRYEKIEHLVASINEMSTAIDTLRKLESQLNKINQRA